LSSQNVIERRLGNRRRAIETGDSLPVAIRIGGADDIENDVAGRAD
jgi:hypothetical protein